MSDSKLFLYVTFLLTCSIPGERSCYFILKRNICRGKKWSHLYSVFVQSSRYFWKLLCCVYMFHVRIERIKTQDSFENKQFNIKHSPTFFVLFYQQQFFCIIPTRRTFWALQILSILKKCKKLRLSFPAKFHIDKYILLFWWQLVLFYRVYDEIWLADSIKSHLLW